jgi:hypothetical protein
VQKFSRKKIIPALLRPGMYAGEQGDRSTIEWYADAVAEYLNCMAELARGHPVSVNMDAGENSSSEQQADRNETR